MNMLSFTYSGSIYTVVYCWGESFSAHHADIVVTVRFDAP